MSTFTFLPLAYLPEFDIFAGFKPKSLFENSLLLQMQFCCLGCWCGAFPIPLDWDRPWQAWPISCVYGALLGYAVGSCVAFAHVCYYFQSASKKYI